MKEYKNLLRQIDKELGKVDKQIKIYSDKRKNEKNFIKKLSLEDEVHRLIGVYQGLYKAYCIVCDLEKEVNIH